jgi:LPXTG-motif cell wall-anchored protein
MRKMNYKLLAAALVAIQISVTAMPMCAMACETEQAETAQEQTEMVDEITEMLEESAEKTEEPAAAEVKEEKADEAAEEKVVEETKEAADEEAEPAEEKEAPAAEQQTEEEEEPVAEELREEEENSENPEQGKAFEQTVTVDRVKIKVTAEEGAFEEGAKLSVVRVPSTQLKQVENAVCDARAKDELVKSAYAFDIKVVGQDGKILKPADGKKVKVSFETEEAADAGLSAVVYHILNANNTVTAKKLATTMNRTAKAAEAQTDGFSYYVVEFVAKSAENNESAKTEEDSAAKTDTNGDADKAKTDTGDDADKAKTDTNDDADKTKTDVTPEETKSKNKEAVTPAAKDTNKTAAEKQEVKKETKTESETKKESEVKKEKQDEKKTAVKDAKNKKTESKKTEKAKTNDKKSPKTGDTSDAIVWIAVSALAAGGILGLLFFRKKQI